MKKRTDLFDRVVLLTGAANGIGAETARQLVDKGALVALVDRDEKALGRLAEELGENVAAFAADVSDPVSVNAAVEAAAVHFGGIDVVVANAGITGPSQTVEDIDPVEFERVLQINLLGVFHTVKAALPHVVERSGYVLLVSSIMAVMPSPTVAAYAASKAGVEAFGRALRIELADAGVDLGIAYFGLIETGMVSGPAASAGGVGGIVAALPAWLAKPAPVRAAGAVMVAGIEGRARRVFAPWYVPMLLEPRVFLARADPVVGRSSAVKEVLRGARQRASDATQARIGTREPPGRS
jgi:NAD(P)-dependent dehydrogenase (short-subunit alcohol dehydrogenase family)